jgi:hypothetical protein
MARDVLLICVRDQYQCLRHNGTTGKSPNLCQALIAELMLLLPSLREKAARIFASQMRAVRRPRFVNRPFNSSWYAMANFGLMPRPDIS